ncbi:MAG: signal recognition particle-docking protein FtsY [Humibacillus sp.]|nr:signal recognition particle-docking protein FtsY [Humibacillus sp.]
MVGVETMWIYVIVAVVILAGGIAFAVSLTRGRGGDSRRLDRDSGPVLPGEELDGRLATDERDPEALTSSGSTAVPQSPVETADPDLETAEPTAPAEPAFERPDSARGRLARLRARLARSNTALGKGLLALLSRGKLDEEAWEEVEDTLIASDLGVEATTELVDSLRMRVKVDGTTDEATVREWLREDLLALVQPDMDRRIASSRVDGRPAVVLVVGVNGTGKTTTVGKLARVLVAEDREVLLGAADTFRAAAADQLETWGARVGVATVRSDKDGADPAAVAFDAVKAGIEEEVDVVIIDTAGRLHNKVDLMNELGKVKRVIEKQSPIDEVLLVLDATTGQNGLQQAKVFAQAVDVTGIVLTKLDGTAKGGIVVAVQRQLGVPVKLVGLGEGPDDLAPFDPEAFVDAIVA